jgi:hypothetical protein
MQTASWGSLSISLLEVAELEPAVVEATLGAGAETEAEVETWAAVGMPVAPVPLKKSKGHVWFVIPLNGMGYAFFCGEIEDAHPPSCARPQARKMQISMQTAAKHIRQFGDITGQLRIYR